MKHYPRTQHSVFVSLSHSLARKQTTMIMLNGTTVDDDTTLKHSDALII